MPAAGGFRALNALGPNGAKCEVSVPVLDSEAVDVVVKGVAVEGVSLFVGLYACCGS